MSKDIWHICHNTSTHPYPTPEQTQQWNHIFFVFLQPSPGSSQPSDIFWQWQIGLWQSRISIDHSEVKKGNEQERLEKNEKIRTQPWVSYSIMTGSWLLKCLQTSNVSNCFYTLLISFDIFWYLLCVQGLPRFDVRFSETSPAQRPQRRGTPLFLAIFSPWSDRGRTVVTLTPQTQLTCPYAIFTHTLTFPSPVATCSNLIFYCLHLSSSVFYILNSFGDASTFTVNA